MSDEYLIQGAPIPDTCCVTYVKSQAAARVEILIAVYPDQTVTFSCNEPLREVTIDWKGSDACFLL